MERPPSARNADVPNQGRAHHAVSASAHHRNVPPGSGANATSQKPVHEPGAEMPAPPSRSTGKNHTATAKTSTGKTKAIANAPFFYLEKTLIWNLTNGLCLVLLVWSAWWAYLPQGVLRLGLGLWVPPLVFAAVIWFAPEILRWNETMHATLNPATRSLHDNR